MIGIVTSMILSGLFGAITGYIVGSIIGEAEIRNKLQEDDALYGKIVEIQPDTVTIEEIDNDGCRIGYSKFESEDGVSDDLYEDQIIYAY